MRPEPVPLREILLCQAADASRQVLLYAVVLRKGLDFELLHLLRGDHVALIGDETTRKRLEGKFQLPVRVLSGSNGSFLGLKTLHARRNNTTYSLKPAPAR